MTDGPPPDPGPPRRTFTLRDAMLLVAGAAGGAWGYRNAAAMMAERGFYWTGISIIMGWAALGGSTLAAVTAALALVRLLPPRPARVALFRQPGFVAACAALTLTAADFAWMWFEERVSRFGNELFMGWDIAIPTAAIGVLVAWATLALAGCWKAEPGWIDRSLRAVALVWVMAGLGSRLAMLLCNDWAY